jgi:hypothetical protein
MVGEVSLEVGARERVLVARLRCVTRRSRRNTRSAETRNER